MQSVSDFSTSSMLSVAGLAATREKKVVTIAKVMNFMVLCLFYCSETSNFNTHKSALILGLSSQGKGVALTC